MLLRSFFVVALLSLATSSVQAQTVTYVGNNFNPVEAFPLSLCQGDCDYDWQCKEDLSCYFRNPNEAVPGCLGGESDNSAVSYCIANSESPSMTPSISASPSASKAPSNTPSVSAAPSVMPSIYPSDRPSLRPSLSPSQVPTIAPTLGPTVTPTKAPTPKPTPAPTPKPTTPNAVRSGKLRLYWEPGYCWQDDCNEQYWCIYYNYDRSYCYYDNEDTDDCEDDRLYIDDCGDESHGDSKFQVEDVGDGEVLIHTIDNRCWSRDGGQIYLESCDADRSRQRWSGNFKSNRFEITQKDLENRCVTTDHHPKNREVVELESCTGQPDTRYWRWD